jgi:hypothetical protein
MATACYLGLENKITPRKVGSQTTNITSVKAADLLATPPGHWKTIMNSSGLLANYLGDFQRVVANGLFPWK